MYAETPVERCPNYDHASGVSHYLFCVECCVATAEFEPGWRGFLTDEEYGPAAVAILCPQCAEREFGPRQLRLQIEDE